jgi:hypothetical protein
VARLSPATGDGSCVCIHGKMQQGPDSAQRLTLYKTARCDCRGVEVAPPMLDLSNRHPCAHILQHSRIMINSVRLVKHQGGLCSCVVIFSKHFIITLQASVSSHYASHQSLQVEPAITTRNSCILSLRRSTLPLRAVMLAGCHLLKGSIL